jgi:hypothetical protein
MSRTGWFILLAAAVVAAIVGLVILLRPAPRTLSDEASAPTSEQKAYLPQIAVSDAKMSAAQNYLGQTVFYLNAKATNKGSRPVQRLDLELEFHDVLDQVVLRETAHPIRSRANPLKPGETRAFAVAFEHLPAEWNQGPPAIAPKYVGF